jgi:membrane associated rhomboid family serine protease
VSDADESTPLPASARADGAATVETDYKKNKFFLIYFVVWGCISLGLFVCSYWFEWGFWGWFGAVFALMVAAGGAGGMAKTGGAGLVNCPSCGETNKILHISEHRIMQCES